MQDQDNKGIDKEGDFEGSLQDMQPDPDADDQEQDGDDEERLDQVCSSLNGMSPSCRKLLHKGQRA